MIGDAPEENNEFNERICKRIPLAVYCYSAHTHLRIANYACEPSENRGASSSNAEKEKAPTRAVCCRMWLGNGADAPYAKENVEHFLYPTGFGDQKERATLAVAPRSNVARQNGADAPYAKENAEHFLYPTSFGDQ